MSTQSYTILLKLHSKTLIKIKSTKALEYLTFHNRLIINALQKSYKKVAKKNKKNDTPYRKNV